MTTPKAQALAARQRSFPCAWCGEPVTTCNAQQRYCTGASCQVEAKAERHRLKMLALAQQGAGRGTLGGGQAKHDAAAPLARGEKGRTP